MSGSTRPAPTFSSEPCTLQFLQMCQHLRRAVVRLLTPSRQFILTERRLHLFIVRRIGSGNHAGEHVPLLVAELQWLTEIVQLRSQVRIDDYSGHGWISH